MQEFILKNLITIIFLLLLVYSFVRGFSLGLIKKVLSLGSMIVAIIATRFVTPIVVEFVKNVTNIESTLTARLYDAIIKTNAYDQFNIPYIKDAVNTGNIQESIRDGLCTTIANGIINLLCGLAVFIVILIAIRIILKVLDVVDYIPVIGQINKILGGVLGVVEIIIAVWILFTVIRALENIPQVKVVAENVKESAMVGYFYKNNIIYDFFVNFFGVAGSNSV